MHAVKSRMRRFLAAMLCVVLAVTLLPSSVSAEEASGDAQAEISAESETESESADEAEAAAETDTEDETAEDDEDLYDGEVMEDDVEDEATDITEITDPGDYTVTIEEGGTYAYFSFTPSETGWYQFYSTGSYNTCLEIYDSSWTEIFWNDDGAEDENASGAYEMEAGETYYIAFYFSSSSVTGSFTITAVQSDAALCGHTVTWTLDEETGTLSISGTGEMYGYYYYRRFSPWYADRESITSVVIDEGVTLLGAYAFYQCVNLTEVTFADSVETLNNGLFYGCTSLESIVIPDTVSTIGGACFEVCTNLVSVTLPSGLTSIAHDTFAYCSSLTDIEIPDGVTSIETQAFDECTALTQIELPENLTTIGMAAFRNSGLTSIDIPSSVTEIGSGAFYCCSGLTQVVISASVETIGSSAFSDCTSLESITVEEGNENYVSVDGVLFDADQTTLMIYPSNKSGASYEIPDTVTVISGSAFYGAKNLETVSMTSVVTISGNAFSESELLESVSISDSIETIETFAFYNCANLSSLTIENENVSLGMRAFEGCTALAEDDFIIVLGYLFEYTGSDRNITIPDTAEIICDYALSYEEMRSVIIPQSVTEIGDYAFNICSDLSIIVFEGSAPEIGSSAFYRCNEMTAYYPADDDSWTSDLMEDYCSDGITWTAYGEGEEPWLSDIVSEAALILTQEIELAEGIDSSEEEEYDEDTETYSTYLYYSFSEEMFSEGDQIIIYMADGSSVTYTYANGWFYDEDESYLDYSVTSEQSAASPWEVGETCCYTLTLTDYDLTVEVPVTICENPNAASAVEITAGSSEEAVIDEAGGIVYFSFTPEESGYYRFYSTGDYDTYAYLYDAKWNLLESDDDDGSDCNALIEYELTAGETCYLAFRFFSSSETGSFTVYAEKYVQAVSAQLILTAQIELIEGIDSYEEEEYDEDSGEYVTYNYYSLSVSDFSSGDQIIVTYADDSTETYTHNGSAFYDADGNRLYYTRSSTQSYSAAWEVGGTYEFILTLYNHDDVTVSVPVSIVENPYTDASAEFTPAGEAGSYYFESGGYYSSSYGFYLYYWDSLRLFSQGDQITITLSDGTTETYTATLSSGGYGYSFQDEDGNSLSYSISSYYLNSEEWTAGTYSVTMTLYGAVEVEIPVVIEEVYPVSAQFALPDGGSGISLTPEENGYWETDDDETWYYYYLRYLLTDGVQIILTLSDGSTETFTYDYDNYEFYNSSGEYESIYWYTTQYSEHWETGGTYYIYVCFDNYPVDEVLIPVTVGETLSSSNITLSASSYTYNGSAQTPTVTVKNAAGDTLTSGTDYTLSYSASTRKAVGTYTITVTGKGSYTGSVSKNYQITARKISTASISLSASSYTYNGSAQTPTVTVKYGSTTLTSGTDYTLSYSASARKAVGSYTITITGKGNFTGTSTKTYSITAKSVSGASVSLSTSTYTYNGTARKPTPTVKLSLNGSTVTLTKGTDYTVSYSNNTNAGTATVKITGTGNYTGTKSVTFTIKPISIKTSSSAYVSCTLSKTSYTYSGSARKPSVTLKVKVNGKTKTLSKSSSSGYTVTYKNNTKIGKATVTITGTGNYTGTITKTFKILPKTMKVKSLTSSAKKKLTVKWTKTTGSVTKYQIRYRVKGTSTWKTKTVSSSKSSVTLTGLKSGKTYQVQIRAYKTVNGTKYYGSWSSAKTKKVK